MANSRIARFITEVAPPQFVSVMRYRTSKMLDTINEEESAKDSLSTPPKSESSLSSSTTTNSRYSIEQAHRAFLVCGN